MSPSPPPSLTRRLALTIAAILAIDLLVVGLVVSVLAPVLTAVGDTIVPMPDAVWLGVAALALLAGFAWLQSRAASAATLGSVDVRFLGEGADTDLRDRVARLAQLAGANTPRVGIVDSDTPNCFSVDGAEPTIVLSEGLLDRLDDDELDAVIGHELAHLQNRDATVLTVATFLPTLVSDEPVAGIPGRAKPYLISGGLVALGAAALARTSFDSPVALALTLATAIVLGGVLLGVLATPVVYLSHRLSHDREFVADRVGAQLAGDPASLASALRKLDDNLEHVPERDLRSTGDLVSELCLLPGGFVRETDRDLVESDEDGFTIRLRSHPPTAERIEQLRALQASGTR